MIAKFEFQTKEELAKDILETLNDFCGEKDIDLEGKIRKSEELEEDLGLDSLDCPEIFYSVTFSYKYYPDSTAVELVPQYLFPKDKIKEHRQAMESRVKKLARQAANLDEKGKELFIHEFYCGECKI